MPTTLTAEKLDKSFSAGPRLFSGLSLRISEGLLAVAGKNGSGKTTLLKILAGLLRASAGSVRVERDGAPLSDSERRLSVGWSGPDLALYGELSARENLVFFRKAAGFPERSEEIRTRLVEVGLDDDALDRRVEEFSSGMTQRLRIAFALLFDPPILLLDEPMAGLDAEGREIVHRIVAAARRRGGVILASNDDRDFQNPDQRIELAPARIPA